MTPSLLGHPRLWLLAHAVLGAIVVAVATHHAAWAVRSARGTSGLRRAEKRFAWLLAAAYGAQFLLGNVLYPRYRIEVRAEYLDAPRAVSEEQQLRERARIPAEGPLATAPAAGPRSLSWVARLFDIKEHLAAIGLGLALALLALSRAVDPATRADARLLYVALSLSTAACAWSAGLIGLYVTSLRSFA